MDSGTELLEQSVGTVDQMLDDLSLLLRSTLMSPDVIPLAISPDLRDFESIRTITYALISSADASTLIDAIYLYSSREDLGLSSDYTLSNYQDYSYAAVLARFQTRKHKLSPYEAQGTATYIYTENNDIYLIQGFSNIKYDQCSCYILFHLDSEQFHRTVNSAGDSMLLFFNSAGGRMFTNEEDGAWSQEVFQCAARQESPSGCILHDWGDGKSSYIIYRTDALTGWVCAYVTQPVSTLAVRYLYSNVLLLLAVLFLGLADSLAEARDNLEFNRYYAQNSGGKHLRTVYIGEIRNLLGTIRREDAGRLLEALPKLIQDISSSFSPKEARQLYQLLLDLLLEQSASLKIDCGNMDVSLQSVPDDCLEPAMERICQELIRRLQGHFNSGQHMYIERAKEFIRSRYSDPNLSLESVAEYVGINPTYLSRLFTSIAQQNFSVYLNQCRVDNAKRLLKSADMTAQEIGYLTGFCSVATFFRVFKKHTGMTPKQFRQGIQ